MKTGIIVLGASGHAKVCIELLREMGEQIDYCVAIAADHPTCLDVPVLAGDEHLVKLKEEGYNRAFIAVGNNRVRLQLARQVQKMGYGLVQAISRHAILSPTVRIGQGVAIMAGAVINASTVIEDLVIVNTGAVIDHDCRIGEAAHIAPRAGLAGHVDVRRAAFLGVGVSIIPGMVIGEDVVVGAGSVVINSVFDGATVMGVPAKPKTNEVI